MAAPLFKEVAHPVTVCAPASSLMVWSAPFTNVGSSFTAFTVMVNVCVANVSSPPLAVPPLSLSTTETVATPLAFDASVYVSVPVATLMEG